MALHGQASLPGTGPGGAQRQLHGPGAWKLGSDGSLVARSGFYLHGCVANNNSAARSLVTTLLLGLAVVGGLALLAWLGIVMLDLKHLNTSGFTLP
jgi:hypothetical protein